MKKILILASAVLLFASCEGFDNHGYPSKMSFDARGGIKMVSGELAFMYLGIRDYNGNGTSGGHNDETQDTFIVTYQWLTVKATPFKDEMTIVAEPNTTGKNRRLYIDGGTDTRNVEIKVTQAP